MFDVCLIYTNTFTQGRLGTHVFDVILPPLGLPYLAAALERENYSVRIIDAFAENLSHQELFSRIENKFRIAGFYCHTQNYYSILDIAKQLKKAARPPHIIIGGPHPTAFPEESLSNHNQIDCSVFGEGEVTIVQLVNNLLKNKSLKNIKGVVYRKNEKVVMNPSRDLVQDLDSLPMPAWHLLPISRYRSLIEAKGKRIIHIIGSRGCFNNCNYCFSSTIWGKKVRWHSPERVLQEIEHLRTKYKIQFFQFFDDNFTLNRKRLKILMDEFRKRKIYWCCSTRADLMNKNIIQQLKWGKVDHVCVGIETIHDRLLKVIGKNITSKKIRETIGLCNKYKLNVFGMFIIGIPSEIEAEAIQTISFACKSNIYFAVFSCMTIYPGTNFFHLYKNSPYICKDFTKFDLSKEFSFVYANRTEEELNRTIKKAYFRFYTKPKVVFWLVILMLNNPSRLLEMLYSFSLIFTDIAKSIFLQKSKTLL